MTCFGGSGGFVAAPGTAPREVESVANCRVSRDGNRVHTITGVSGGVRINPAPLVARDAIELDRYGKLAGRRNDAAARDVPRNTWWWD